MARRAPCSIIGLLALLSTAAKAATIFVAPGPGTPVQDAINAASPNDTVRLAIGAYPEHVTITKPLKLRGVTSVAKLFANTTHLDGGCGGGPVVTVAADDVQIRDLAVGSDAEGAFDVQGHTRVKLRRLFALSNCVPVTAPAYNVAQSTRVVLDHTWAAGFGNRPVGPSGIRIADIAAQGRIRVQHVISGGYDVGVLLENDGASSVSVSSSDVNFNDQGILLQATAGVIVEHNRLVDNTTSGIEIDAGSNDNRLVGNTISGSVADVVDNGTGNCWRNNTFATGSVAPCP